MRFRLLMVMALILLFAQAALSSDDAIYVVQPKATALLSRFETVLSGVYNLNNRYVSESGLALSGLYHFHENLAAELQANWFFKRMNSQLYRDLISIDTGDTSNAFALVKYYRSTWLLNAALEWSILYGKLSFYNFSLGDMGIYVLAGAGLMGLELSNHDDSEVASILKGEGILPFQFTTPFGVGMRIHFAKHFGLRFELRDNVQVLWTKAIPSSPASFYEISHKVWLTLGVAYVF